MTDSRAKGYRGEAELVRLYEAHGFSAKRTAAMQAGDDDHFPDVTAYVDAAITIANECKNRKTLPGVTLLKAMAQADDAYPGSPNVARVVAMRLHGKPGQFIFAMRESTFFDLLARSKPEGTSRK